MKSTSDKSTLNNNKMILQKALTWLQNYQNLTAPNFDTLINDFKIEAVDILKNMTLNALQGKQQEDVEKRINGFVSQKIQNSINE